MWFLVLLAGCTQPFTDTASSLSGSDDSDTPDGGSGSDTDADIDEQTESLEADPACEGHKGQPIPGATSYFLGDFSISGTAVTGTERWALLANDAWAALGNEDCVATWSVTGTKEEPTKTCGSCDYSLSLVANLDASLTTCPEPLVEDDAQFSATYNVKLIDGSAIFYFATSGNELATGTGTGSAARYVSDAACTFF